MGLPGELIDGDQSLALPEDEVGELSQSVQLLELDGDFLREEEDCVGRGVRAKVGTLRIMWYLGSTWYLETWRISLHYFLRWGVGARARQ